MLKSKTVILQSGNIKNLLIIAVLLFTMSCENAAEKATLGYVGDDFSDIIEIPSTQQPPPSEEFSQSPVETPTKKVVKSGGIIFESKNIVSDYKKIREILPKYQAYIENENQSKSNYRINYNLTIRVPSAVYDTLFGSISSIAAKITSKYSNVEDVTERYYDLKSRIKNKKALEARYVQLLKKATAIKDILEIERNLNIVRTEIENLQGKFNFLSKRVTLSTIELEFHEKLPYVYDPSDQKGFGAKILNAIDSGWQGFLVFLVGLPSLWPFIILTIGLIYLINFMRKKWRKRKKQSS